MAPISTMVEMQLGVPAAMRRSIFLTQGLIADSGRRDIPVKEFADQQAQILRLSGCGFDGGDKERAVWKVGDMAPGLLDICLGVCGSALDLWVLQGYLWPACCT